MGFRKSLKSAWRKLEYAMTVSEMLSPPPEPVRKDMEAAGWQYDAVHHVVGNPYTGATTVVMIKNSKGECLFDNRDVRKQYREDLKRSARKHYKP